MQEADEHKQDELFAKFIKSIPLESPGDTFTEKVMDRIDQEVSDVSRIRYTPPISRPGGVMILVVCLALVVLSYWTDMTLFTYKSLFFERLSFSWDAVNQFGERISNRTLWYAAGVFILGMGIQLIYLKRWHSRSILAP